MCRESIRLWLAATELGGEGWTLTRLTGACPFVGGSNIRMYRHQLPETPSGDWSMAQFAEACARL